MSVIWNIGLFEKMAGTEAKCRECERTIKMSDRSTKGLFVHAKTHEKYAAILKETEQKQQSEKNALDKFIKVLPKGIV
jgi:hypothetical protein